MKCVANPKTSRQIINAEVEARIDICNNMRTACDSFVLLDKFGFTKEDVARFNDAVQYLFDSIVQGYTDFDSVLETMKNEYQIEFVFNKKGKR